MEELFEGSVVPHQQVDVVEVAPRDGLQNEPQSLATERKVELIRRLFASGLKRVEVASFVNPKRVPQMADAEALMQLVQPATDVYCIGLVLNQRGFERAVAAGCKEIGMVVVASDTFNRRNQGVTTDQSIATWLYIASAARAARVRAQITISAAFGCPFEGEVPVERVIDIAERVAAAAPYEICFADTIGVGAPAQVDEVFSRARRVLPGVRLRGHFHNTRNTGLANAYAAVLAGASALDSSVGGIGGCPFAPAATGNIPTEDLVYMLERCGIETGVSLDALIETAHWLQTELGRPIPGMLSKAGAFPRVSGAQAAHH